MTPTNESMEAKKQRHETTNKQTLNEKNKTKQKHKQSKANQIKSTNVTDFYTINQDEKFFK